MAEIALFEDLEAVRADAAGALDRSAQPSLFDRLDWYRLLDRHCPADGTLRVVRARDGERSAWLFLDVRHPLAESRSNFYSLRFDAIGARDVDLLMAIAATLRGGGLAEVDLAPIPEPAPLIAAFRNAGWRADARPFAVNWRVETAGLDFDSYWAARPGRLRNTARRRAKAAKLDVRILDRFQDEAWRDYERVYRASWKPEEGSFPFLRALAEQEGAAGTLRLGLAYSGSEPVATQLWLVENGEATIHKLAYAEAARDLSPGTVLSMAMFRHALDEDRVRRIDYGNGDEPYKAEWMAERRTLWQLEAFNPRTLRGLAGLAKAWLRGPR